MILEENTDLLRHQLDDLAADADDELLGRYELRRPPAPPGLYWKARWLAGKVVRGLKLRGIWRSESWPVSLKQASANARAKPLLIWALGTDRDTLRTACERLSGLLNSSPGFAPVLVTDVADFAFFSRLGWLVEYVPSLPGEGVPYDVRKTKFLARVYRGAPALPANVVASFQVAEIQRWLDERR